MHSHASSGLKGEISVTFGQKGCPSTKEGLFPIQESRLSGQFWASMLLLWLKTSNTFLTSKKRQDIFIAFFTSMHAPNSWQKSHLDVLGFQEQYGR